MTLFAAFPAIDGQVLLAFSFKILFLLCFVRVMAYGIRKIRAGRLINTRHAPPAIVLTAYYGWAFVVATLVLLFIQSAYYMFLVVMGISLILLANHRTAREQFGLDRLPLGAVLKWSLLICGAVVFVEVPLTDLLNLAMNAIHLPHPDQESVEVFRQIEKPGELAGFLLLAVVISPMIEELFFRGFLLTYLKNFTSTGLAIVLSAGVFAFAHANLGSAIQLWFLGIILGIAYEHTGSLVLPMGIHACWNFATALSLLLTKATES